MLSSQAIQKISKDILQIKKDPIEGINVISPDSLNELKAIISAPNSTPYENGQFVIRFHFDLDFPNSPPKAYFTTKIFHPNVDLKTGEICVNTLKKDWNPSLGLKHVLMVIRCLMIEPNPDSALNAEAGHLLQENYELFVAKARMFTQIHAQKRSIDVNPQQSNFQNKMSTTFQQAPQSTSQSSFKKFSIDNDDTTETDSKENQNSSNQFIFNLENTQTTCTIENQIISSVEDGIGSPSGVGSNAFSKKVKKSTKMKRGLRRL